MVNIPLGIFSGVAVMSNNQQQDQLQPGLGFWDWVFGGGYRG
jgi:hypothetical protein